MSKEYKITINAHPSIYDPKDRKINVYFSEPENGVNKDTGVLLLISGYIASAESKVYIKMRKKLADTYNLVTVQCNYFGYEFMQVPDFNNLVFNRKEINKYFDKEDLSRIYKNDNINTDEIIEICKNEDKFIPFIKVMNENLGNFNDMGIMQAIDNLTAVYTVINIIKDNDLKFNENKIISYGVSHGAYLAHLCNAFAPNLFNFMIDNSAWMYPKFLKHERRCYKTLYDDANKVIAKAYIRYDYLGKKIDNDEELLDLNSLYSKFQNKCNIIVYQGTNDELVHWQVKKQFCSSIKNCSIKIIREADVDGEIFKSTNHCMDADFIKTFDYSMINYFNNDSQNLSYDENVIINTNLCTYGINYSSGIPILEVICKN